MWQPKRKSKRSPVTVYSQKERLKVEKFPVFSRFLGVYQIRYGFNIDHRRQNRRKCKDKGKEPGTGSMFVKNYIEPFSRVRFTAPRFPRIAFGVINIHPPSPDVLYKF
jgi:hypothetical protein